MARKQYEQIEMYVPITHEKHLTTKEYVDLLVMGKIKNPVLVATTANLEATYNLAGKTLTANTNVAIGNIDGVAVAVADRILVKNQSDATQNGIYVASDLGVDGTSPYILTRALDFDTTQDLTHNMIIPVMQGTQGDARFQLISDGVLILDSTELVFTKYYTSTGANTANGIIVGDGVTTDFIVNHNLGTKDILCTIYEGDEEIGAGKETTTINTVTARFGIPPAVGQTFRVVAIG
jgi:hypothetical protein